jgi:adenylosuccinate synthase
MDLVALKYAVMINGVTQLIMTKSDVLSGFETIKVAVGYKTGDEVTEEFPFELPDGLEPVYKELPGWNKDLTGVSSEDEFPQELKDYIAYLEKELEVPITIVSVGPGREQTIVRK